MVLVWVAVTLALGAAGGFVFDAVGLPAPWLSGAMVFVALAGFTRIPTTIPDQLRDGIFVVLGVSMGAGVRPDVVERLHAWPLSIAILGLVVVGVTASTYVFLHKVGGWDREAAYFGAIPGALSLVMALAAGRSADIPRIAVSQSFRLFVLVAVLPPLIVGGTEHGELVMPSGGGAGPVATVIVFVLCTLSSVAAVRLRVPGGWLTGAFFMSSALNATGLLPVALPQWMVIPCYVALGAMIGARFGNTDLRTFLRMLAASFGGFLIGFGVSALGAWLTAGMLGLPFGQLMLAYAPGGLEAMTLLAFMLNLDPAFVATHQLARYIGMVLLLPFATRLTLRDANGKRIAPR